MNNTCKYFKNFWKIHYTLYIHYTLTFIAHLINIQYTQCTCKCNTVIWSTIGGYFVHVSPTHHNYHIDRRKSKMCPAWMVMTGIWGKQMMRDIVCSPKHRTLD